MDAIIEQYQEQYNYPSVNKLHKYLKDDGHKTSRKYIDEYLSNKDEVQQFEEVKKSKKKRVIFYLIHQMRNGSQIYFI